MLDAERLAERLRDPIRLARVLASQTYLLAATGDLAGAIAAGERALEHLVDRDDLEGALNARLMLARSLYAAGRYREAIGRARDVVALLGEDVERGAVPGSNQTASARAWLTICHAELGEFESGVAAGETALQLAAHPRCSEHD